MAVTIGQAIKETAELTRSNIRPLSSAIAILLLPGMVTGTLVSGPTHFGSLDLDDPRVTLWLALASSMSTVFTTILVTLGQAVAVIIAIDSLSGTKPSLGGAFRRGFSRTWRLLAAVALQSLAILGGFLALVIPGLIAWAALALTVPVVVVENEPATQALKRSWQLTKGYRGVIFVAIFALSTLGFLVQSGLNFALTGKLFVEASNAGDLSLPLFLTQQALAWGISVLWGALGAALTAVFYIEIKNEKEGVNVEALAAVFE